MCFRWDDLTEIGVILVELGGEGKREGMRGRECGEGSGRVWELFMDVMLNEEWRVVCSR